tara:strand:- start:2896 stop:3189 length:294 start_codon:yes stop_codon:yes gene_type:complete
MENYRGCEPEIGRESEDTPAHIEEAAGRQARISKGIRAMKHITDPVPGGAKLPKITRTVTELAHAEHADVEGFLADGWQVMRLTLRKAILIREAADG